MKAAATLIAWDYRANNQRLGVGPLIYPGAPDWTRPASKYPCTGGAAYTARRKLRGVEQKFHVMLDAYQLVSQYGLHPYLVHRALSHIEEYRLMMTEYGMAPDPVFTIEEEFHFGAHHLRLIVPSERLIREAATLAHHGSI